MQNLLRIVAPLKLYGAKPCLETLAVEPFFDGMKNIAPEPILDHCTHGLYPSCLIKRVLTLWVTRSVTKQYRYFSFFFSSFSLSHPTEGVVNAPLDHFFSPCSKSFPQGFPQPCGKLCKLKVML